MDKNNKNSKFSELILRIMSSLILAPIVLYIIYLGDYFFIFTIMLITVLMGYEWVELIQNDIKKMTNIKVLPWKLAGLFYIVLPFGSLIWLRDQPNGMDVVYWLIALVWATDIAAFFTGRAIGGWKLAPSISPNKTWSGLIGGVIAAGCVGAITAQIEGAERPLALIGLSAGLGIYAQVGDLLESWLKRSFGVKNSGNLLPGHGGILDRVDGIVLVAPKVVIALLFDKLHIFVWS